MTDANHEIEQDVDETEIHEPEQLNEPADSSPDSGENHEEKQNGIQKRFNDLTAKRYQAERERDELAKRLAELEKGNQQQPAQVQQEISEIKRPEFPSDMYDEEAMRKYHSDMAAYAEQVAEVKAKSFYEGQQKQAQQKSQQDEQTQVLNRYIENAQRSGVDLDKLRGAEQVINQHGISQELAAHLMKDANGPQVITYLADNPAEMYEVLSMSPLEASVKIATDIKAKALSKTPKVSKAPDPQPDLKGGGALEVDEFEKTYGKLEFL